MSKAEPSDDLEGPEGAAASPALVRDVPAIIGTNLRRLRKSHGFSLERLAELSGVSRAMLGQIETGKSVPTVSLLWRVADAFGVPVTTLVDTHQEPATVVLSRDRAQVLVASSGLFFRRILSPAGRTRAPEFFELRIAPRHREQFEAAPAGTRHNLVVAVGVLTVAIGNEPRIDLEQGDAIAFEASSAFAYENKGSSEVTAYLVVASPAS
jgi:transcriptional regulator with XRE-family HTH domain